jgi:Sugar-transfer associated ATP-grasp
MPDPSSFNDRFTRLRGMLRKHLLRWAEGFAYDVSGFPMALTHLFRLAPPADNLPPAEYLHRHYAWRYWRLPLGPLKGAIAALTWPIALAVAIAIFTRRNGTAIRDRNGASVMAQVIGQFAAAARHSIAPFWYYMFELHLPERARRGAFYLTAHETIGPAYSLLQPPRGADGMDDKVWFAEHCHAMGISAVPVLMHFSGGASMPLKGGVDRLPDQDLFVKPRSGSGGHRMERWDYVGDGTYRNSLGEIAGRDLLTALLKQKSLKDDFLVQPRLDNHASLDDISNGALATVRVLTCRNENGEVEATNAAFRMAIGGNSVVDNFHQGGLATAVDLATGRIGAASDMGIRPDVGWREEHPVSGARFAGRHLPHWKDVVDLACRVHETLPGRIVVGWDIAMLADGACVIEGNGKPDLDIHQRVEGRPLGDRRIAALLALNVGRALRQDRR